LRLILVTPRYGLGYKIFVDIFGSCRFGSTWAAPPVRLLPVRRCLKPC